MLYKPRTIVSMTIIADLPPQCAAAESTRA